jgi:hypothetical protein
MAKTIPTFDMTGINTISQLIILTYVLSDQYNHSGINFFNTKAIIDELRDKNYITALDIFKCHFENFVYIYDKGYFLKRKHEHISNYVPNPEDKMSIVYDAAKVCQIYKKNHNI